MGRIEPRLIRNIIGTVAVFLVVAGIGVGLPALNSAMPSRRLVPAGPFLVAAGVRLIPPPGAQFDVTKTKRTADQGAVLFVVGNLRYTVAVLHATGSLHAAATALRTTITERYGYQLVGAETPTATRQGVPGLQGGYATAGRAGRYVVFVHDTRTVQVTFAGSELDLHDTLPALAASVASLTFTAPT